MSLPQRHRRRRIRTGLFLALFAGICIPSWGIVGYVRVETVDDDEKPMNGVQIVLDGQITGVTADGVLVLEVSPGEREIAARTQGFETQIRSVTVRDEELVTIRFVFSRSTIRAEALDRQEYASVGQRTGSIVVRSVPVGDLPVFLDGVALGFTDIRLSGVGIGSHQLTVGEDPSTRVAADFDLQSGEVRVFQANLLEGAMLELVAVTFDVMPATARLFIDGQEQWTSEVILRRAEAYAITVTAPQHEDYTWTECFDESSTVRIDLDGISAAASEHSWSAWDGQERNPADWRSPWAPRSSGGAIGAGTARVLVAMGVQVLADRVPAGDFLLSSVDGEYVALSDFKGKLVLLSFWASWSSPCRSEMPSFQHIHETLDAERFVVVTVSVREAVARVKEFCLENGYTFPVLADTNGTAANRYNVSNIPLTYVIDPEGYMIGVRRGYLDWSSPEAIEGLRTLYADF